MTAPIATQGPDKEKIKRNLAKMESMGASEAEMEEYLQSEGLTPTVDAKPLPGNPDAPEQPTAASHGSGTSDDVGMAEGVMRAGAQGLTLGFSDELAGLAAGLSRPTQFKDAYVDVRDRERAKQSSFADQHGLASGIAEAVGGLAPSIAAGPAGLLKGGTMFGAASALGHAEGTPESQAEATAVGAGLGAALGGIGKAAGKTFGALADKINPKRVARRNMATLVPDDAEALFAKRQALTPGATVPGDLSPETAALSNTLGKSAKGAITGRRQAFARVKEIATQRKAVGKEYDALNFDAAGNVRAIPVDPVIQKLADDMGMPLANPSMTTFAEIHRLRHEAQKIATRARGMAKNDAIAVKEDIDFWLQGHVPEVKAVDARYAPLTQHLSDALSSLKATKQGNVLAAKRGMGAGTRQGNRLLGIPQLLQRVVEPSPARKAEALQKVAFNPQTAEKELGRILQAREGIVNGPNPFLSRDMAAQAGAAVAPQLSSDTASAHTQAIQMRSQGVTDAQLEQQLSAQYTPSVVKFILAATPQRLPQ